MLLLETDFYTSTEADNGITQRIPLTRDETVKNGVLNNEDSMYMNNT